MYATLLLVISSESEDAYLSLPAKEKALLMESKGANQEQLNANVIATGRYIKLSVENTSTNVLGNHPTFGVPSYMKNRKVGINGESIFGIEKMDTTSLSLPNHIRDISFRKLCEGKPVFMTMAKVTSKLYWELIENFFGTMKKFGHLECALMICIRYLIVMNSFA